MKIKQLFIVICIIATFNSCGSGSDSNSIKDEQLSSFMLGGIYFFNGYGGESNVKKMMSEAGYTTKSELIHGYKEILEFPFDKAQASGIKSIFSSMWDITDKASLLASIEDLKSRDGDFKSWNYARIINNACMGYAAGWLSKQEVIDINASVLPLARKNYKNWDDYYSDFEKGREDWNENDPQAASFKKLAKNMTKGEDSIYNILPLNTSTK